MCGEDVVAHSKQTLTRSLSHTKALDSKNRVGCLACSHAVKTILKLKLTFFFLLVRRMEWEKAKDMARRAREKEREKKKDEKKKEKERQTS